MGYYRNPINHYADITNVLTRHVKKDQTYLCTEIYPKAFSELKGCLQTPLILINPELNKPYFALTDASKIVRKQHHVNIH